MILIPDTEFIEQFEQEITEAINRVLEQSQNGENQFLPISAMWPHGAQDILGVIFTKSARAVGYEMAGNLNKVREEAQDILNYSGFLLTLITLTKEKK